MNQQSEQQGKEHDLLDLSFLDDPTNPLMNIAFPDPFEFEPESSGASAPPTHRQHNQQRPSIPEVAFDQLSNHVQPSGYGENPVYPPASVTAPVFQSNTGFPASDFADANQRFADYEYLLLQPNQPAYSEGIQQQFSIEPNHVPHVNNAFEQPYQSLYPEPRQASCPVPYFNADANQQPVDAGYPMLGFENDVAPFAPDIMAQQAQGLASPVPQNVIDQDVLTPPEKERERRGRVVTRRPQRNRAARIVTTADAAARPGKRRAKEVKEYDPAPALAAWGPPEQPNLFLYHHHSNSTRLKWRTYTSEQLRYYFDNCPRDLRLWVQQAPAQCNHRTDVDDRKCRWSGCPAKPTNKILAGWLRVAFDEFYEETTNGDMDPLLVAGSMHLWCFEQCFNPVDFMKPTRMIHGEVKPGKMMADARILVKEDRNPMALTRDTDVNIEDEAYGPWYRQHMGDYRNIRAPVPWVPRPHPESLSRALVQHHLEKQVTIRQDVRDSRNEKRVQKNLTRKTQDVHLGDLSVYCNAKATDNAFRTGFKRRQNGQQDEQSEDEGEEPMSPTTKLLVDSLRGEEMAPYQPSSEQKKGKKRRHEEVDYNSSDSFEWVLTKKPKTGRSP